MLKRLGPFIAHVNTMRQPAPIKIMLDTSKKGQSYISARTENIRNLQTTAYTNFSLYLLCNLSTTSS